MIRSGAVSARLWWAIFAAILLVCMFALSSCIPIPTVPIDPTVTPVPPDLGDIHVTVTGADGKSLVKGVVLRVTDSIISDDDDHDELKLSSCPSGHFIAAWAPGYQVGFAACTEARDYWIPLVKLENMQDNQNYLWLSAYSNCGQCHAGQLSTTYNEIGEWVSGGHSKVFTGRYFETIYRGTDISGISGPATEWAFINGKLVRRPNLSAPEYKGPGFQLDFPGQAGSCAFCHAPAAISSSRTSVDLAGLFYANGSTGSEGITCDVCHKVTGVNFASGQFPFEDRPGILSFQTLRSDGLTIGPFSNVMSPLSNVPQSISMCASIFSSSDFCAPCHYGKFGETLIYSSYKEWRDSQFSKNPDGDKYRTCQDCHMSRMLGNNSIPYSSRTACSETAEGFQDFSHNLMDFGWDEVLQRNIPRMIRGAAELDANFVYEPEKNNSVRARVFVENARAGHKFPTDSPLRHLILVVEAQDQFDNPLIQVDGDQIPTWGGVNNSYMQDRGVRGYAGMPGKIFANLLVDSDINQSPTTAYWNETKPAFVNNKDDLTSDNRLPAQGMDHDRDVSDYFFSVPSDGQVHFKISLIYRFAFYDLMQQKRWPELGERQDIPVVVIECTGNVNNAKSIDCEQTDPPRK